VVTTLARNGTEAQRKEHLPRLATGEIRAAFSLSEPDAGSDAASLRCKATPDGDEYVIDGTKMWVTNGQRAGLVALAARTPEGITCTERGSAPPETRRARLTSATSSVVRTTRRSIR
jgi:alkylation response protein AidB-like acyl-CoA dehydrogenase